MDSIEQAAEKRGEARGEARGVAKGVAKGKAETFLLFARRKFKRVPRKREAQVRAAAPEQIDDWMVRAVDAPDLEAVFNSGAVIGRGPVRKKPSFIGWSA